MKKLWWLKTLLWGLCAVALLAFPAAAAPGTPVLALGRAEGAAGRTVEIPVTLDGGFIGYQMDVLYDPACLSPVEVKAGDCGVPAANLAGRAGDKPCVRLAFAAAAQADGGVLFTLRFRVVSLAAGRTTPLHLENVRVFDPAGRERELLVRDGGVAGPGASSVAPSSRRISSGTAPSAAGSAPTSPLPVSGDSASGGPASGEVVSDVVAPAPSTGTRPGASTVAVPSVSGVEAGRSGTVAPGGSAKARRFPLIVLVVLPGAAALLLAVLLLRRRRRR